MAGTLGLEVVEAVIGGRKGGAGASTATTAANVAAACPELLLLEKRELLRMAKELRGMVRTLPPKFMIHIARKARASIHHH